MKYLKQFYLVACLLSLVFAVLNSQYAFAEVSEKKTKEIIEIMHKAFEPDFSQLGLKLDISISKGKSVDALTRYAFFSKRKRKVFIQRGFINSKHATEGSVYAILCHELGHNLGGFPLKSSLMSVEGQADYWAANICLPRLFRFDPDTEQVSIDSFENKVEAKICEEKFNINFDLQICVRGLKASYDLGIILWYGLQDYIDDIVLEWQSYSEKKKEKDGYYLFVEKHKNVTAPVFESFDPVFVKKTFEEHPNLQCRLDTMIAGVLSNPRPRCWFKPK